VQESKKEKGGNYLLTFSSGMILEGRVTVSGAAIRTRSSTSLHANICKLTTLVMISDAASKAGV
jgi:hypothetical protein